MRWKFLLDELLEITLPRICFACNHDIESYFKEPLCIECYKKLNFIESIYCRYCGRKLDGGNTCYQCSRTNHNNFLFLRSVFMYNDHISSLIIAYKYHNYKYLYKWFSQKMYEKFLNYYEFKGYDSITYIPLSPKRLKERGYNQTEIIAKELSNKTGITFLKDVAIKIKDTKSQVELSKEKRLNNLKDAFKVVNKDKIYGRNIIVIDDVATTMSTLNEFSKVLKESGAKNIACFTIARE